VRRASPSVGRPDVLLRPQETDGDRSWRVIGGSETELAKKVAGMRRPVVLTFARSVQAEDGASAVAGGLACPFPRH
jgi:hypothetical protein